jgi:hypothetical protein
VSPSVYLCHEIGAGDYYAYLWDEALRAYFRLPDHGHMLATNLHADTLEEAREQACGENRVPTEHFRRMNLILFLRVHGHWDARREIVEVWESDGISDHVLVYDRDGLHPAACRLVNETQITSARSQLNAVLTSGAKTIEQVRHTLLETPIHS